MKCNSSMSTGAHSWLKATSNAQGSKPQGAPPWLKTTSHAQGSKPQRKAFTVSSTTAQAVASPHPSVCAPRADDDFLSLVEEAEQRDMEDDMHLELLHQLEEQTEIIEKAAAQIAHEQSLSPRSEEALTMKMLHRVQEQAQQLRTQMVERPTGQPPPSAPPLQPPQPPQSHGQRRPTAVAGRQQQRPGMGTLEGILSRSSPRCGGGGDHVQQMPNPVKGRGDCHPLATQHQNGMPSGDERFEYVGGAAGQRSSAGWRAGNELGGGSIANEFRLEHHQMSHPDGHRHLHTESKVSFGGNPAGLYPRSNSMIRGKFPGY